MKHWIKDRNDLILFKNISGTFIIKGISIIVTFMTTPAYISFFNDQGVLGVWFTMLSILQWILIFDLGIGNGLRNKIVPYLNNKDSKALKEYISSGYIILGGLSTLVLVVGSIVIGFIDWNTFLNVSQNVLGNNVLILAITIVFVGIMIQFVLKVITSILFALQKNVLANMTMLVSNIIILTYLLLGGTGSSVNNLIGLAIIYAIAIIIPLPFVTFVVFTSTLKGCFPSFKFFKYDKAKQVLGLGGAFFLIQVGLLIVVSTNAWLISYSFNSEAVVEYQIYYMLFTLPSMLFTLITQPIWSGITAAKSQGNISWIRRKYKMINLIASIGGVLCLVIVALLDNILALWIQNSVVEVNYLTALVFAVLTILRLFMYASTSIANGLSELRCQAICISIAAVLKIPLTFLLADLLGLWESVVIAEILCILPLVLFQPLAIKKYFRINNDERNATRAELQ